MARVFSISIFDFASSRNSFDLAFASFRILAADSSALCLLSPTIALVIFITFIFSATAELGGFAGFGIAPFSISLALGLTMLELLVAVIQAYVFALLTAVFIGMAIHVDH